MKKLTLSIYSAIMLSGISFAGGDIIPEPVAEPVAVENTDEWNFQFSPMFLWAASVDGDSTVGPVTGPIVVDFGDAIDELDMAFTLHFEANKGDWTLFTEYQYLLLRPSQDLPNDASMGIDFRSYIFELGGAYAFNQSERSRWEAIGGFVFAPDCHRGSG